MKKATLTVIDTLSNAKNPFWKMEDSSIITLLHFETYGQLNAPRKFKIEVTDLNSTSVIEVDPILDIESQTYGLHYLGYTFDTSKVKIEIIALKESGSKERLRFRLHYETNR